MSTTIAFFDATAKEKSSFEHYFAGPKFKLLMFSEPIQKVPVYEFKEAQIVSIFTPSHIDAAIMSHLPKLKYIAARSTGIDNIDTGACKKQGIAIGNVPGYGQTTVAEYAVMLMLMLARKMPSVQEAIKSGHIPYKKLTGFTLHGKTLGVVGTGKIGMSVVAIAKAMGMHVIAHDPFPNHELAEKYSFSYVSVHELFKGADVITLHTPLTPRTKHIINEKSLNSMKESAILINTARGELVETSALIRALQSKKIAGAAMDVIEGERTLDVDIESELFLGNSKVAFEIAEVDILSKMSNVILSPHNAFNSNEALQFIRKTTALNIQGFLQGKLQNNIKL